MEASGGGGDYGDGPRRSGGLNARDVANILWGAAKLTHTGPSVEVTSLLLRVIYIHDRPSVSTQDLSTIFWALSTCESAGMLQQLDPADVVGLLHVLLGKTKRHALEEGLPTPAPGEGTAWAAYSQQTKPRPKATNVQ